MVLRPKEPTAVQERIIKIFEDTPLFTGLDGFETGNNNNKIIIIYGLLTYFRTER